MVKREEEMIRREKREERREEAMRLWHMQGFALCGVHFVLYLKGEKTSVPLYSNASVVAWGLIIDKARLNNRIRS